MSNEKIAKTYAISLFSAVNGEEDRERAESSKLSLQALSQIWGENKELAQIVNNPSIAVSAKKDILLELLEIAKITDEFLINFTKILIENKRFSLISLISSHYNRILTESMSGLSFEVVSAFELDNVEKESLKELLVKQINNDKLSIDWSVNSELIGGLQIKFGDKIFDTSVNSGLKKVEKDLLV